MIHAFRHQRIERADFLEGFGVAAADDLDDLVHRVFVVAGIDALGGVADLEIAQFQA